MTPSWGMIRSCTEASQVEVHAMIRTRGGDFTCTDGEMRIMLKDIEAARRAGARGVVFGVLEPNRQVSQKNHQLVELAHSLGLQVTFHRAFDQVSDPEMAVELLLDQGFDRLLSSGLKNKAIEGIELLRELQKRFGRRIQIMAGSGINPENAMEFANAGLEHLHFTARIKQEEESIEGMGNNMVTDETKIRAMRDLFKNYPE